MALRKNFVFLTDAEKIRLADAFNAARPDAMVNCAPVFGSQGVHVIETDWRW